MANMFRDSTHPLAGRISAGVKTTLPQVRRAHSSMDLPMLEMPTMQDYARNMFSPKDQAGTRVYYCETIVFNTNDTTGRPINFINGLFKTGDAAVQSFLQQFVEKDLIKYLEIGDEDVKAPTSLSDQHQRSEGSSSGNGESDEPNQPKPGDRIIITSEAAGSGTGGKGTGDPEQSQPGPISSSGGDGDDGSVQERTDSGEPTSERSSLAAQLKASKG
jgi:hypothetical protein